MLTSGNIRQNKFGSFKELADAVKRADQEVIRRDKRLTVVSEPGNPDAITIEVERTGTPKREIQVRS